MSWRVIARKDIRDAVRSYWLWGLSGLFVLVYTVPAFFLADRVGAAARQQGRELTSDGLISVLVEINAFFVPIIAIGLAYAAIAGERDTGSIKLLLSLPHSRRDLVVGTFLGRSAVVLLALTLGVITAALSFLVTPVRFVGDHYVLFVVLTALLAVVFVGISIGVSAAAQSARRAMVGTVALYVTLVLFWDRSTNGLAILLTRYTDLAAATIAKLHLGLQVLNPTQAYKTLTMAILSGDPLTARVLLVSRRQQMAYAQHLGESVPAYLSDPVIVGVMIAWLALAPAVGYSILRDLDL